MVRSQNQQAHLHPTIVVAGGYSYQSTRTGEPRHQGDWHFQRVEPKMQLFHYGLMEDVASRSVVERSVVERSGVQRSVVERSVVERSLVERSVVERSAVERKVGMSSATKDLGQNILVGQVVAGDRLWLRTGCVWGAGLV
jgi:hypothetical protein